MRKESGRNVTFFFLLKVDVCLYANPAFDNRGEIRQFVEFMVSKLLWMLSAKIDNTH